MFTIYCEDPDHASRVNEPGWLESLGQSSVENARGYLCPACAEAKRLSQPPLEEIDE